MLGMAQSYLPPFLLALWTCHLFFPLVLDRILSNQEPQQTLLPFRCFLLGIWSCWVFGKGNEHREQAPSTRAVALIHQSVCAV